VSLDISGSSPDASTASEMVMSYTPTNATLQINQQNWAGAGYTHAKTFWTVTAGQPVTIVATLTFSGTLATYIQMVGTLLFTPQ
jgi:hypothetical protein